MSTGAARYAAMFAALRARGEGAFVPFLMLGDPDPATSLALVRAVVRGGADALELGLPFSDPIADGPVIQAAVTRALAAGVRIADGLEIVRTVRAECPALPIGLLVYANLVVHDGVGRFFETAAAAGADSVVMPDVPALEEAPFAESARENGVAFARIAPPNASAARIAAIARSSEGYVYITSRAGVTGADELLRTASGALIAALAAAEAAPALLGFGISTPEQVRAALAQGAAGAISGSAVVEHLTRYPDPAERLSAITSFVAAMKAATRGNSDRVAASATVIAGAADPGVPKASS